MADHSLPVLGNPYADYNQAIKDRLSDLLKGLDPAFVTATNVDINAQRFSSAASKWQKWNGTSWTDLAATYAIAISGNAATATVLASSRTINGVSFNGSANITVTANTPNSVTFSNSGSGAASGLNFNGSAGATVSYNTIGAPSATGAGASGSWGINITGNASSADTAAYAVTAGSASSASGVTNGVYTIGDQSIAGAKTFTGSIGLTTGFGMSHDGTGAIFSLNTGNLIYKDSAVTRFTFAKSTGNFTASGDITAFSDERLKCNWKDLPSDFILRLSRVKFGTYERIDTGQTQVGVSAQSLRDEALPTAVVQNEGGTLSVAYGNAALVSCVALAQEIVSIRTEIEKLSKNL